MRMSSPEPEPPHAAPAPSTPAGRRIDWADPALADATRVGRSALIVLALLIGGACVDAGLMQPAIMSVLRGSVTMSLIIAFALSVMAAVAAGWAGHTWAGARGNTPGQPWKLSLPVTIMAAWAALGGAIFWLRMSAASTAAVAGYAGADTSNPGQQRDVVAAGVFLVVYILIGLLAFGDLRHLRNDAFQAKLAASRELAEHRALLLAAEVELQRLSENHTIRRMNIAALPLQEQLALDGNQALANELKQLSRWEQALGLRDVTTTGITSAHHVMNPAEPSFPAPNSSEQ